MNTEKIFMQNSEWSVTGIRRVGNYHEERREACQDFIACTQTECTVAIALADGAGSCTRAEDGARITAEIAAHSLAHVAEQLEKLTDEEIRYHVLAIVRKALNQYCRVHGLYLKNLGSTIVAAAATHRGILLVHLGDGWIMKTNNKQERSCLSFPENGIRRNQTYLTSMIPVMEHVRIKRVPLDDVDAVTLFSDGWGTETARYDMEEIETALETGKVNAHWDDVSAIRMTKNKSCKK